MYRSAVAIGYQNAFGQNKLYGTGVLIKSGRHFIVVTARHVILDKNLNLLPGLIFWGNTKQGKEFSRSFEENRAEWKNIRWVIHDSADIAAIIVGIKEAEDDVYFVSMSDFLDVKDLKKGESVYYLGFPRALGADTGIDPVLRHGIVSLKSSPDYFYIDATAAGGNSGGPVFRILDSKAYFIGIVTDFPWGHASEPEFYYHTGVSRVYSTNQIKTLINSKEFEATR
jgi:S1-C subfamily serine protease